MQTKQSLETPKTPEAILKTVFGYDQFKPLQREVIENILNRRDTLTIMPTGGGKSLCYQIPALIFSGLTVVVSPLIALMKDQVEQLREAGVPALFLNSSLSPEAYQRNYEAVRSGRVKLLYVAPETLLTPRLFNLLDSVELDCLAIDEAHCISEWGHDFRPEYRQLMEVRQRFPKAVCVALTATATPRVRQDIQQSLRIAAENGFVASFNRENLMIEVLPKRDSFAQTLRFLKKFPDQSGIIYCLSRKQVDDLALALQRKGYRALPYHAGLEDDTRRKNQELFIRDDVQIIVATIAFGMGINKPNVRFILHFDLPKSIEGYYQEIGRAGRDGLPAHCLLLYSYGDVHKLRSILNQKDADERQMGYEHLKHMTHYGDSTICRRVVLLSYFGEKFATENCGKCDNCLKGEQAQVDITVPAQKFMSCVIRTGESFGAGHVTDVLLGSKNEKILRNNHQNLSTYGIGIELKRDQWMPLARLLVQKGLLAEEGASYPVLKMTAQGHEILRKREAIMGVIPQAAAGRKAVDAVGNEGELVAYDRELFDILRAKRKELADLGSVPPYVIFPDRALIEMAAYYPQSAAALRTIHGVGQVKFERYGEEFLSVIGQYCREKGLLEKVKPEAEGRAAPVERIGKLRYEEVAEAYNAGKSIPALVETYQVKEKTILDHLAQYAQEGKPLRASEEFVRMSKLVGQAQDAVMMAFAELGCDQLRPVYDRLNGAVNWEELRIMRLHYLSTNQAAD
jgi:ATP-dependent DNA helicase RecQ